MQAPLQRTCRSCRHFRNDADFLEAAMPGLASMSSGHGSVKAEDGVCLRHDRYLGAEASCADHEPKIGREQNSPGARGQGKSFSPRHLPTADIFLFFNAYCGSQEQTSISTGVRFRSAPMTDLPHEPHGLCPPTLENWLIAFGTALVALIAIGILPRIWG